MNHAAMGERIKAKRKELNLTQVQFANMAGVSTSFMGHIERGSRIASIETLYAICEALHVSSDYLIGLSEEEAIKPFKDDLTPEEWQIGMKLLHKLTGG